MTRDEEKKYDVFISHASEDKAEVARPLADYLMRSGVKVWLDSFELRVGDSLRESIDHGLTQSRFGIVILSPSFFKKDWPKRELNGLFAVEEGTKKVILPVWHNVSKSEVGDYSPILADRIGANTQEGLRKVARELVSVVLVNGLGITVALARLIDSGPQPSAIAKLLELWPAILAESIGLDSDGVVARTDKHFAPFDLLSHASMPTWGGFSWHLISFLPSISSVQRDAELEEVLSHRELVITKLRRKPWALERFFPYHDFVNCDHYFSGDVFYGRRDAMSEIAKGIIRKHLDIDVHSYDRLLDASVRVERSNQWPSSS